MDRGFSQAEFSAASEPEVCGGSQALESDGEIGEASIAHLVFSRILLGAVGGLLAALGGALEGLQLLLQPQHLLPVLLPADPQTSLRIHGA